MGLSSDHEPTFNRLEAFVQENSESMGILRKIFPLDKSEFSDKELLYDLLHSQRFMHMLVQLGLDVDERSKILRTIHGLGVVYINGQRFQDNFFLTIGDARKIVERGFHNQFDGLETPLQRKIAENLFS